MKRLLIFMVFLALADYVSAQEEKLRLTFTESVLSPTEFNLSEIKDVSFVNETETFNIEGEWFNFEEGIFESFKFSEDGLVDYYYYLLSANSGGKSYGKYLLQMDVLGLKIPIFYGVLYTPMVNYSNTHFTLRNGNKSSIYYKIQKTYNMNTYDTPIEIGNKGDVVTFVDNVVVGLEDGKIKALQQGQGYALVQDSQLGTTVAYRIDVQYKANPNNPIIDWTQYFNKTRDEIVSEFGTPTEVNDETYSYRKGYNPEIENLIFSFKENDDAVYIVTFALRGIDEFRTYKSEIERKYVKLKQDVTDTLFGDTDDEKTSSVLINISENSSVRTISYLNCK